MYIVPSTVDWCEENHVYSFYIAEFWNTFSSLLLAYAGYRGYVQNKQWNGSSVYLVLMIVGIGSVFFHSTLTAFTQMLDEIPMIFLLQYLAINVLNYDSTLKVCATYIVSIAFSVVIAYTAFLKDEDVQEYSKIVKKEHGKHLHGVVSTTSRFEFFIFQGSVIFCALYIFKQLLGKATRRLHTRRILIKSCSIFVASWSFWLLDYFCCNWLRQHINPQFHAWWHIGSAISVYKLCSLSIILKNEMIVDLRVENSHFSLFEKLIAYDKYS